MADGGPDGRVPELERRVAELERRLAQAEAALAAAPPMAYPPPYATPPPMQPGVPPAQEFAAPGWAQPWVHRPAAAQARPPRDLETVLGANWLAKAGMLVLALGVVFFLRLAYQQGWVPIGGRFAIGVVGGLGLWVAGDLLRGKVHPAFAQVLAGGGACIAYATVYAGHAIPEYRELLGLGLTATVLLLSLVSAATAAYAAWRRAEALAALGGSLSAILVAPLGEYSAAGVLALSILQLGLLAVCALRRWPYATLVVQVATFGALALGAAGDDVPDALLLACAAPLALAAWAAAGWPARPPLTAPAHAILGAVTLVVVGGITLEGLGADDPGGWALLGTGILSGLAAAALPGLRRSLAWTSFAALALWPVAHFGASLWTPGAQALLAAALVAAGLAIRQGPAVRALLGSGAGLAGFALLSLAVLLAAQDAADDAPVAAGAAAAGIAAVALAAWAGTRDKAIRYPALAAAAASPLLYLGFLLDRWAIPVAWTAEALLLVGAGFAAGRKDLRVAGLAICLLVLGRIFLVDLAGLSPIGRVVAFLVTGTLLLSVALLVARARRGMPAQAR